MQNSFLLNSPDLWLSYYPKYKDNSNKYDYGHAVIIGGEELVGAAKMAAISALRVGSGLVTIVVPKSVWSVYAADTMSVMVKKISCLSTFNKFILDQRKNILLVGPGAGVTCSTEKMILSALYQRKSLVIDADGLTIFAKNPDKLFKNITSDVVLTPHEGEFSRIFPDKLFSSDCKMERAVKAAKISGAIIVLKGHNTIIADKSGKVVKMLGAPAYLATAGTGDVLSGLITGLMARGMDGFNAACMAVWLQTQIALKLGIGMISEDMPKMIPVVMQEFNF